MARVSPPKAAGGRACVRIPARRRGHRGTPRRLAATSLLLVGGSLLLAFLIPAALGLIEQARYQVLAQGLRPPANQGNPESGSQGRSQGHLPNGVRAWLRIEGTPIDYPVAQADVRDPLFYLDHDPWGHPARLGCPFVDARCGPTSEHLVVYGHHFAGTTLMFSCLHATHVPRNFEELAGRDLIWTDGRGESRLRALCALRVPSDWPDVQRFDFGDDSSLPDFLCGICRSSSAKSPDAAVLCQAPTRAVTLVTCSSLWSGQPWRTLVVYCEPGRVRPSPVCGAEGE